MFTPEEVQNWRQKADADPCVKRTYCGHYMGAIELVFPSPPLVDTQSRIEIGRLQAPKHIFGQPFDPKCLEGVGTWPIHAAVPQTLTFVNARIVGNSAVLTDEGLLYTPQDARAMARQDFLRQNAYGHQGFLVDDTDDRLTVRYAQREVPRTYPMNAIFLHSIEPTNYGSFMFRQLPQLLALRDAGLKYDCYIVSERTRFLTEALALLKLPDKPIFTADEVVGDRIRSLTLFQIDDAEGFVTASLRIRLASMVAEIVHDHGELPTPRGIYVSRSLSALRRPWYRVMKNELEVEGQVQERGLSVVYPEILSLVDQLRTFAGAARVIGPSGSGMFNVMFARDLRRVVDIETHHVTVRQHAKLYASCGAQYAFLFSPYNPDDDQNPVHRSSICPPELLGRALGWLLEGD
jgi:capsular polysaccharide biosynthesis protein